MSIAPTGTSVRRTWTQEESDPSSNRFGVMAILAIGIIGLTAMVLYLLNWSGAKTCAVSISITDYGQRFPKPKFGVWQSEEFKEIVASAGAKEWTFNPALELTKLQNTGDIKDKLAILPGLLKTNDLRDQDTVIVQLRCHARIAKGADNEWLCGLIVGENDQNDTIPFEEFLSELQSIQAKNIVLLADVCDLKSQPSRGLFANPIASYLLKACEQIPKNNDNPSQNVWVVCSAADFQTSHVSESRQKTLFQDACEHALGRVEHGNLFLADYYEQVFQYCHVATRGKQTPLLMRAGDRQLCTPDKASWKSAKEAIVSWKGRRAKVPAVASDKAKSVIPVQKTSQAPNGKNPRAMRLVAMQQKPIDPSAATAPDATQSEPVPEPIESDSTLRFWQLRGELQDRKLAPWSPIDFAPQLWRRQQSDYAKSTTHLDDLSDLEELKSAMASDSPIEARGDLAKAWNNFRESNTAWRLWETYSEFTADDQAAWTRIKNEYYRYSSLCDELMHWRDWALEQIELRDKEDIELKEIKSEYRTLCQALKDAQDYLPFLTTEFALEKSKRLNLNKAEAAKGKLKSLLGKRIQYARENWESQELTWLHEREFQTLVHSPLLSLRERKELLSLKKASNYQKPAKAVQGNLSNLTTDGYWRGIRMEWAELIQSSVDLIPELNVTRISQNVDSYDQLLDWGNIYVQRLSDFETDASKSSLAIWHSWCFRELGIEDGAKLTKSYSGIVVTPTNSRAILMSDSVPDRPGIDGVDFPYGQRKTTLNLDIRQADDAAIDVCKLEWNSHASSLRDLQVFVERNGAFVPFERGKKVDVQPRNKRVQLQFELPPNRYIDGQATLTFIASRADGKSTDSRIVNVTSDAERIGLEARQILAVGEPLKPTIIFDPTTPIFEFEFVAIKEAVCQYRFTLVNKIQQPRFAKLRVLADLEGDGNAQLIAESELVALANRESKEAALKAVIDDKKKLILQITPSRMLFEIIECDKDGNPLKKAPAKIQAKFIALNPANFLDIDPESLTANRKINFSVKARLQKQLWERTALKQISVDVDWERLDGIPDPGKPGNSIPLATRILTPIDPLNIEGPLAFPDSLMRFHFHVGGYARASIMHANVARQSIEEITLARAKINEILPLIENKVPPLNCFQIVDDTIYFKNFLPSEEKVAYRGLIMRCELDLGYASAAKLAIDLDGKPQIPELQIDRDRTCIAELTFLEGMLDLKFDVTELVLTEKRLFLNPTLNGQYSATLANGEKSHRRYFVFDQDKPNPGTLELNRRNRIAELTPDRTPILYENGIISAIMNAKDDLSGLERIDVAVSNSRSDRASFVENDVPLKSVKVSLDAKADEAVFDVKASEFQDYPQGNYWIVARSYDRAGNYQNQNSPLKIYWSKSEAPQKK